MKLFTSGLLIMSALQFLLAGGGWTRQQGDYYFKLNQYLLRGDGYFSPEGKILDITTTGYYSTSFYTEYGISDKLDAVIYLPFFVRSTLNRVENTDGDLIMKGDELNSVGDPNLALKYGFFRDKRIVLATSVVFGIPIGNPSGGRTELLQSGDGEFNQMLRVDASTSFSEGAQFLSVYSGFNNRTQGFSDDIHYGVEFGAHLKNLWIILRIDGVKPLNNGSENPTAANGIFSNRIEYLSPGLDLAYNINKKVGISAGVQGAVYAKRILAAPAFNFGFFLNK